MLTFALPDRCFTSASYLCQCMHMYITVSNRTCVTSATISSGFEFLVPPKIDKYGIAEEEEDPKDPNCQLNQNIRRCVMILFKPSLSLVWQELIFHFS
jgi:hypothetical protein